MNPQTLLAWWNLIFVMPFGLALLYLSLYATTGIGAGEVDADADADVDADAEMDGDAEADADADTHAEAVRHIDTDTVGDTDHDVDDGSAPLHPAVLGFLGVGHVPAGFLLIALLMTWVIGRA